MSPGWSPRSPFLTHRGRVSQYMPFMVQIMGLSPARRQPIIWTIDGLLSISLQATYFQEILFGIQEFRFKKMHFKMSSAKRQPSCLGLSVFKHCIREIWMHGDFINDTDTSPGWPPQPSPEALKASFSAPSDNPGSHLDDVSVSVIVWSSWS